MCRSANVWTDELSPDVLDEDGLDEAGLDDEGLDDEGAASGSVTRVGSSTVWCLGRLPLCHAVPDS